MSDSQIPARWRPVIWMVWVALILLFLIVFVTGLSPYYNELLDPCNAADCPITTVSTEEMGLLSEYGLSPEFYAGYMAVLDGLPAIVMILAALLIFWRMADSWMGFLLSLALVFSGSIGALGVGALARQYNSLAWPFFVLDALASILFVMLFYLFPDGRFVPRWTRFIVAAMVAGLLLDVLLINPNRISPTYSTFSEAMWLAGLLIGALAQIYRYRRISTPTRRQQTKWIMFGLITIVVTTIAWTLLFEIFPLESGSSRLAIKLGFVIAVLLFTIFPVTVVFSILKYRLWDIDILINRTLVYGLLTGVLALLYLGLVVLLQSLFRAISDQSSPLAIVASTLVIAALFHPLRRRIQRLIDRRFYRRNYDAIKTLAAFSAVARDEVDMDALMSQVLHVVNETFQPATSSLWLAGTHQRDRSSTTPTAHLD